MKLFRREGYKIKKKVWALISIVLAIAVFTIIGINNDDEVYSEKNCPKGMISCVNAVTDKNSVKVVYGTSVYTRDGDFIHGDVFGDWERRLDVLKVDKNEIVTLEFFKNNPLNISGYQLDGSEREKEIDITQHTFIAPSKSGTYKYELFGEYSNGTVHHYLKIRVK